MVNVLSDAGGVLDIARNLSGFRRSKNLQAIKARNAARISKGRSGFPKPLNINPPGLSKKARQFNDTVRIGGTQLLQNLLDTNAFRQEGDINLIYQQQIQPILDSIENKKTSVLGSSIDQEA